MRLDEKIIQDSASTSSIAKTSITKTDSAPSLQLPLPTIDSSPTDPSVADCGAERAAEIREEMRLAGKRFWANDNISEFLKPGDDALLVANAAAAFETVLDALLIDRRSDPNSKDTAKRLARMYFHETMSGRYVPSPAGAAFPNEGAERYEGLLVIRAEVLSLCSHHHQPVTGTAFVGIVPGAAVVGLSKYIRIAQWCARRGTLQEALCNDIAKEIGRAAASADVAVYLEARHGCCENRGVMAHSSLTQTTVATGKFKTDTNLMQQFMEDVRLQK